MGSIIHYIISFRNKQLDEVEVKITDYQDYDDTGDNTITNIDLVGVAPAFELETFNTNEDKFSPILGQRATIRFKSTNAVNFSTFATGEDYRFFVRATYSGGAKYLFSGWLLMDENQQLYLPPGQPITLYATDNLAALKDIELSDFDGARPSGKHKLIKIIAWCLDKTTGGFISYMDRIYVADNLFENNHDNTDNCPLNQTYVDILTFEKRANELKDCFTVLEEILFSLGARLCKYGGDTDNWYIMRIDEYKNSAFLLHRYNITGDYVSTTETYLDKYLDSDGTGSYGHIDFVEASTVQRLQRRYKSAIVKASYDFPDEIPDNNKFLRGTFSSSVAGPPSYDLYIPDSWTYVIIVGGGAEGSHSNSYYTKITYDTFGAQIERFLYLPATTGNVDMRLKSSQIQVCEGDKFNFSLDFRYSTDLGGGSGHYTISQAQMRLFADDGTFWTLYAHKGSNVSDESIYWEETDSSFTTNSHYVAAEGESQNTNFTEWQSISLLSAPLPRAGYIVIHLVNNFTSGSQSKDFYNIDFDYIPLINGTTLRRGGVTRPVRPILLPRASPESPGEQFKMSTTDNYSKKFEENFLLFDAPCKMFKGAMFYLDTGVYYLTSEWLDEAILNYNPSEMLTIGERFLKWQVYYVWNQVRLPTLILQGSLFGLDTAIGSHAGLIHKYWVLNALSPTNNKNFIILSMRQDWHNCTWTATFAEVSWNADRRLAGDFEFKYLEA